MTTVELLEQLHSLVIFRKLLRDPIIREFQVILEAAARCDRQGLIDAVAVFESDLYEKEDSWSRYLLETLFDSENIAIHRAAADNFNDHLKAMTAKELDFLDQLAEIQLSDLYKEPFPVDDWRIEEVHIHQAYDQRIQNVHQIGYGLFSKYHVFTVEEGKLIPVKHPDPQRLSELPGYESEREKVIANTRALLNGLKANNVLLYGDAGTGKSSSIKAIANEFAPQGLRLIEVRKDQLYAIPDLVEELSSNPLKFILFIDDLSFASNDDHFAALKAILEGSVSDRSKNIAIYATSNRRHLVKETMSDRTGDDIHENDTRQELMSLSARFGLIVTFSRPNKDRYLTIVRELCHQYDLTIDPNTAEKKAEIFAIRAGGRTPRAAKQFVEQLKAGVLES